MRKITALSALGLTLASALSIGCVRGADVQAPALGLRRVVIYRNGVAYFERSGLVQTDQVTFRVRKEKVGDFLATLAVMEKGGSSVRSASFPVDFDKDASDDADEEPVDPRYEILLKPPIAAKKEAKEKDKLEKVTLTLDGLEHDLLVGYVAETPVWRPSYRLVIDDPKGGAAAAKTADMQVWGIVQNQSGENWKGVTLSLVAGAPIAFQATLDKPVIPLRPIVSDQGEVFASVPTGETSLAEAPPPPPASATGWASTPGYAPAADEAEEQDGDYAALADKKAPARTRGPMANKDLAQGRYAVSAAMKPSFAPAPKAEMTKMERPYGVMPQAPRNVTSLAAVAMQGGTTRYDIPFPVDIPDKSATMVLLLAKKVPAEASFMFSPDPGVPESSSHPFRVARFTNDTKGLLERGPIAVFANGAFLGQGLVEPLPPGATTTVPFALERSLGIDTNRDDHSEGARVAKVEAGELEIERDYVTLTKYTIKNGDDTDAKVLVKHARQTGFRLVGAPTGTEDNVGTGSALVPIEVAKHASAVLTVDERRGSRQHIDWLSPLADEAVKAYIADARADKAQVAELNKAWPVRTKLLSAMDESRKLETELSQLERQVSQHRTGLKSVEKNKSAEADELRKTLTERLAKALARMNEINPRLVTLSLTITESQIRFRDIVTGIKITVAPPPEPGK